MMAIFQLQGVILVYDITSKNSFEAVPKWLSYVRQVNKKKNELLTINVVDKETEKEVMLYIFFLKTYQWIENNNLKNFRQNFIIKKFILILKINSAIFINNNQLLA